MSMHVLVFTGTRSQLLQHVPVERTVRTFRAWEPRLVLSAEKGDHALWPPLLEDYAISPCHRLGPAPASLSDASLLAHIMGRASLLIQREAPAAVLVYGHSVTTLAAALAAAEHGIPVIHVGAGQLPRDMNCPEGRHAGLTDRLSSLLCCLDPADEQRLHAELMERGSCVTGDTLYDLFEMDRPRLRPFEEAERHGMAAGTFILCYLRHPATLRSPERRRLLLEGLQALHARQGLSILLVQHPSALSCFQDPGRQLPSGIRILPPLTHVAFLSLLCACVFAVSVILPRCCGRPCMPASVSCFCPRCVLIRSLSMTAGTRPAPLLRIWPPPVMRCSGPVRIRACPGPAAKHPVGSRPL